MKKKLIVLAVLALFFISSGAVLAFENEGMGPDAGQQPNIQNQGAGTDIKNKVQEMKNAAKEKKEQIRQDILVRAKKAATNAIERAIAKYGKVKTRVQNMPNISAEKKAEVTAKIDAEITKLQSAKARVAAATTVQEVKTVMAEVKAQIKSSINAVKEVVAAIHATHLGNMVDKLNNILTKLTAKVTELKNDGKDVTAMEELEKKAKQYLDDAKADISGNEFKSAKNNLLEARKALVELAQKIKAEKGPSAGSGQGGAE